MVRFAPVRGYLAAALSIVLAAQPAAADTPLLPAVEPSPSALVTFDSTRGFTVIERRANQVRGWSLTLPVPAYNATEQWEAVCVAPCALRLDPNGVYRVGGGGVAPSSAFVLPRGQDPLRLHVHAGSSFWHDGGIVLALLGAGSMVVGVAAVGAASGGDRDDALRVGGAFFLSGLAVLALGATLWLVNGSSVRTDDGRSL